MPVLGRAGGGSVDGDDVDAAAAALQPGYEGYDLTPAEEQLVQATQSSLNSAGLALVLQAAATGLLLTAHLATGDVAAALEGGIQVRFFSLYVCCSLCNHHAKAIKKLNASHTKHGVVVLFVVSVLYPTTTQKR
jgi:hypothetical protein